MFTNGGSGWIFNRDVFFDIHIDPYKPVTASSYFPLPKHLTTKKKAIINIKNKDDNECFKWAVTCATYPQDHNAERLTKNLREDQKSLIGLV